MQGKSLAEGDRPCWRGLKLDQGLQAHVFTYPFVLKACASESAIDKGREVHGVVFDGFTVKDVVFWNTMKMGYARNGMGFEASDGFREMVEVGEVRLNEGLLSACAQMGAVNIGNLGSNSLGYVYWYIFGRTASYGQAGSAMKLSVEMRKSSAIARWISKEAKMLIERMDSEPNVIVWGSLFNACSIHGEWAADHIFDLEAIGRCSYVLLANIIIEIGDVGHEFLVTDKAHPKSEEIYWVLDVLSNKLKMAGSMRLSALDEGVAAEVSIVINEKHEKDSWVYFAFFNGLIMFFQITIQKLERGIICNHLNWNYGFELWESQVEGPDVAGWQLCYTSWVVQSFLIIPLQ
ncbi:pentatricopeptide repeat-containing protein [Pyrus ussuriensis x Pyrus communis]|uniref:Pentatricopeptide repeat-containing protein n=1 Tax=Pyrus ussuriensis x Pyrus communis TaxID=2448454 RepID=A0A5N5HM91_9ROSA|nr:pentatricopeptide repeat-containing protein [Pyrus ussuriensis x Pyrus communis]